MKVIIILMCMMGITLAEDAVEFPFLFGDGTSTSPKILFEGKLQDIEVIAATENAKSVVAALYGLSWRLRAATTLGPTSRLFVVGVVDRSKKVIRITDWYFKAPFYYMNYEHKDVLELENEAPPDFKPIVSRKTLTADDFTMDYDHLGILTSEQKSKAAKSHVR